MMENDVLTMRICKSIIGKQLFLRIIKSVPSKRAESLKAWLAMVGRERIWMRCCRICSLSCLPKFLAACSAADMQVLWAENNQPNRKRAKPCGFARD